MTEPVIHRVTALDLAVQPWPWPWAAAERGRIDAHFAEQQRKKPSTWNGRVLLARKPDFRDGRFSSRYFETDFASFLAWRDWGFPDPGVFNGFGMAALRSADGAFVLGVMGGHTMNAGRIYFPAGTPDPADVAGDELDMAGSIAREMEEETGLAPADYRAAPYWDCIVSAAMIAIVQVLDIDMPGDALKARIEANLARQEHPELSGIHLVRTRADFRASMPRFVTAFLESEFDA